MTKCFDSVWSSCYRQTLSYWRAYSPICTMLYHNMFSVLVHDIRSCGLIQMTTLWGCQSLGSVFFLPLNVAPEGLAQDGAWWLYFTVYWLSGSARAPHLGPVWTLWLAWLTWREGKREGLFMWCFCLSWQAYRETANGTRWMGPPSSVRVCCPSSAVLD